MNPIELRIQDSNQISLSVERGGGTHNYSALTNKPSIEGHVLEGDSTLEQIGVGVLSVQEIEKILYEID